jgi:hypothetical protein
VTVTTGLDQRRAVWRRVSPAAGQVLDLLHARVAEPYAPHLHGEFSIGACSCSRSSTARCRGIPYLLIKVAVGGVGVPVVVFGRTAVGALLLLPFALRSGQLGALRRHWR